MSNIQNFIDQYQDLIDKSYNSNTILIEIDKDGFIVQQRGPELGYKIRPEAIEFKNPSV